MRRPRITPAGVIDRGYIVRFSSDVGGGMIELRYTDNGRLLVYVNACDPTVDVGVGWDVDGDPTPVHLNGRLVDRSHEKDRVREPPLSVVDREVEKVRWRDRRGLSSGLPGDGPHEKGKTM